MLVSIPLIFLACLVLYSCISFCTTSSQVLADLQTNSYSTVATEAVKSPVVRY